MAHWPKTVRGKLLGLAFAVVAVPFVWLFADALPGPIMLWVAVAALAIGSVVLLKWHRRVQDVHDLAAYDGTSFGDAVRRMRAKEAIALGVEASARSARSASAA